MKKIERRIKSHLAKKGPQTIWEMSEYFGLSPYKLYHTMEDMKKQGKLLRKEVVGKNETDIKQT